MFLNIKKTIIKGLKDIKSHLVYVFKKLNKRPLLQLIVFAVTINLILEMLSSRSVFTGFSAIIDNPLMFIYNVLIVFLTLSIANFFTRKGFVILLVFIMWMWLGIVNFILLGYRTTPFTGADIRIFKSVFGIIHVYLNNIQLVFISILLGILAIVVIYAFRKLPKNKVQFKNAFFALCCTIVLLMGVNSLSLKTHSLSNNFGNIAYAFQDYGFAYCFTTSLLDHGINEPKTYSVETVEVVMKEIEKKDNYISDEVPTDPKTLKLSHTKIQTLVEEMKKRSSNNTDERSFNAPNIVMIQLESFFDVKHLVGVEYSSDPTPNFTKLKSEFSSGFLTVPSVGAGTANTEFEILSGMNLDFFGAGEYPYKTILKETAVESICYDLDELGYHSHAIHNNTGTFYSRHKVYPNLGFDSFSSIEYMNDVEYNPLGWSKDKVLETEIIKAFETTEEQDFIFAVSVQPHGKYPDTVIDESQFITMTGDLEESEIIGYEYFINQLNETDAFVGSLLTRLKAYKEPVVIVIYGDHLPSMDIENENLDNNNKFQTEYVLWSNFPMDNIKKDLSSYQLNAYVMERLGYDNGILTKFHQKNSTLADYQEELLLLQYDMLYGDRTVFGGLNPHVKKDMTMGMGEIEITNVAQRGETIFVMGKNFTMWSEVYFDGVKKDTLFVDKNTLIVANESLDFVEKIYIGQVTDSNKRLSKSEEWLMVKELIGKDAIE